MSRKFNIGQLPTGSYSITGSFSGSFIGDGSGLQGITATADPAGPVTSVQFNDGLNVSGSSQFTFDKTTGGITVVSASIAGITYPTADGMDRQVIKTDGAGNLEFGYPESITIRVKNVDTITLQKGYPVHNTSSGTSGNIIGVVGADAGDPLLMPAAAILNETLAPEAEGEALLSGFIQGVNTAGFTSGDIVYVAVGGGYTQTKPTGSALVQNLGVVGKVDPTNGSGIVYGSGRANDIPNLTQGYVWIGNADRVATAIATSSIQQVVSSSYAVTASFALNGGGGGSVDTGSLLTTASVSLNTITFTKGDGSTFPITVDTGSGGGGGGVPEGTVSSSAQITELGFVTSSATASFVLNSQTSSMTVLSSSFAITASHALNAGGGTPTFIASGSTSASAAPNTGVVVEHSGSTAFSVIGDVGTLFSVDDDLNGMLFTANDISGFPVLQASASGEVYVGKTPQSLYTTAVISSTTAATTHSLCTLSTSSYDGAFFEYTAQSASNARAGNIMSTWNGTDIVYAETTTADIGRTSDLTTEVIISGSTARLVAYGANAGYKIKTIIKAI